MRSLRWTPPRASTTAAGGTRIELDVLEQAVDRAAVRYDREGDQHYDVVSAFIKSIRGSDVDAALHYLARMIEAGEDPRFIARRLVILASEDVGLAEPARLGVAVAAAHALELVGLPEARLNLAQADDLPRAGAQEQRRHHRDRGGNATTCGPGWPAACRAALRDAHYSGAKRLQHGERLPIPS